VYRLCFVDMRRFALPLAAAVGTAGAVAVWAAAGGTRPAVLPRDLPAVDRVAGHLVAASPAEAAARPASLPGAATQPGRRPRLVVVGSGWGAVGLVKSLPVGAYDVTVVSDRNYFLFTPLLPSITVGALDTAAVVEAMHGICARARANFALVVRLPNALGHREKGMWC
jgi:hypothetical protein